MNSFSIALLCVSFGLRISEALALQRADVDWLNGSLRVERAIVNQQVDEVKTPESQQSFYTGDFGRAEIVEASYPVLGGRDWMFPSPTQLGRLPWSYDQVWLVYQKAAKAAALSVVLEPTP